MQAGGRRFDPGTLHSRTPCIAAAEPELGVLLRCNVVVYRRDDTTHIDAIDAERMLSITGNNDLAPIARQVRDKLARRRTRRGTLSVRLLSRTAGTDAATLADRAGSPIAALHIVTALAE